MTEHIPSSKSMVDVILKLPTKVNFDPAKTMKNEIGKVIGVLTFNAIRFVNTPISIGSLVRLKLTTQNRVKNVKYGSVGSVKGVYVDDSVLVSFPQNENWSGRLDEIEHVE